MPLILIPLLLLWWWHVNFPLGINKSFSHLIILYILSFTSHATTEMCVGIFCLCSWYHRLIVKNIKIVILAKTKIIININYFADLSSLRIKDNGASHVLFHRCTVYVYVLFKVPSPGTNQQGGTFFFSLRGHFIFQTPLCIRNTHLLTTNYVLKKATSRLRL